MKNKRLLVILVCMVALSVAAAALMYFGASTKPVTRKNNGIALLSFAVGDKLEGYTVTDSGGNAIDVAQMGSGDTLIVFGMEKCRDCIAEFPTYEMLYPLYHTDALSVVFLWDDGVPKDKMADMGIPEKASFTASGNYKFTDWVPTYYLVNNADEIIAQTTEIDALMEMLAEYPINPSAFRDHFQADYILLGEADAEETAQANAQLAQSGRAYACFLQGSTEAAEGMHGDAHSILSNIFGAESVPTIFEYAQGAYILHDGTF